MSNRVSTPFPIYNDTDGTPLDAGFIFIGAKNTNPQVTLIPIFYDAELTMPAENPARTRNGFISKNGAARQLFCAEPIISILVQNKRKMNVWNSASINLNPGVTTNAVVDIDSGKSQEELNLEFSKSSENLNDLNDKDEARENIDVYSKSEVDGKIVDATEETKGVLKIATESIAIALTDDTTAITPKKIPAVVKAALAATGDAPIFGCRAWVCFDGSNANIKAKGNIATVVRNAVGLYTITFEKEMPIDNYVWSGSGRDVDEDGDVTVGSALSSIKNKTKLQLKVVNSNGDAFDSPEINISIFC